MPLVSFLSRAIIYTNLHLYIIDITYLTYIQFYIVYQTIHLIRKKKIYKRKKKKSGVLNNF